MSTKKHIFLLVCLMLLLSGCGLFGQEKYEVVRSGVDHVFDKITNREVVVVTTWVRFPKGLSNEALEKQVVEAAVEVQKKYNGDVVNLLGFPKGEKTFRGDQNIAGARYITADSKGTFGEEGFTYTRWGKGREIYKKKLPMPN